MSRGFQKNAAGELVPFDDEITISRSQPDIEPVAWLVERPNDPTFPQLFKSEAEARALVDYVTVRPAATIRPLYAAPQGADTREATIQAAADYLYEEVTKLDAPIPYTACLALVTRILALSCSSTGSKTP